MNKYKRQSGDGRYARKTYVSAPIAERDRVKEFKFIKEYQYYYLYGKYDINGKLLYRECFNKFDIDGVEKRPRVSNPSWSCLR